MAAAHSQRKKTQPQTTMKQLKTVLGKKTVSQKKQLELKQGKQEPMKLATRRLQNMKNSQHPSVPIKVPQQLHQKKAPLSMKGNGKTVSLGKNVSSSVSSQAKYAKMGRNLCTLTSKELQRELNEMMHRQMGRNMFANNSHVLH